MRCRGCLAILALTLFGHADGHRGSASLLAVGQARQSALEAEWSHELESSKASGSPVRRVVELLLDMKKQLDAEAKKESATYDKMVCWCESSEKEKTQAISDADARMAELTADLNRRAARGSELAQEESSIKSQIVEDVNSVDQAEQIHASLQASTRSDENSLTQSITDLQNAIAILERHHGSLLELGPPMISSLQVLLREVGLRYSALAALQTGHSTDSQESPQISLLATAASTERMGERLQMGTGVSRALFTALMGRNNDIPDVPVKMAQHLVARAVGAMRGSAGRNVFLQTMGGPAYAPASGQILGVLRRMLTEFEGQLRLVRRTAGSSRQTKDTLAGAKNGQISVARERLDNAQTDAAANAKALSDDKEEIGELQDQRSADMKFLANLRHSCTDLDANYDARSKTRSAEIQAVAQAIQILTEDENRERLSRSLSFTQTAMTARMSSRRMRAFQTLHRAALDMDDLLVSWRGRHEEPDPSTGQLQGAANIGTELETGKQAGTGGFQRELSMLASSVRIDSFTKIKEMIKTLVAELAKQQREDDRLKQYCREEFAQNERAQLRKADETKQLASSVDFLAETVNALKQEIEETQATISETRQDIKGASGTREQENLEFQTTVQDQRATQTVLKAAMLKLKDFYEKGIGNQVALLGEQEPEPLSFVQRENLLPAYKTNSGASPVIGLLENILGQSQQLEAKATQDENRSQADYEVFVHDANSLITQLTEVVAQKAEALADAKLELVETKTNSHSAKDELGSLTAYESDLHHQCDAVLAKYTARKEARAREMEAMRSAKAILSGAREQLG